VYTYVHNIVWLLVVSLSLGRRNYFWHRQDWEMRFGTTVQSCRWTGLSLRLPKGKGNFGGLLQLQTLNWRRVACQVTVTGFSSLFRVNGDTRNMNFIHTHTITHTYTYAAQLWIFTWNWNAVYFFLTTK